MPPEMAARAEQAGVAKAQLGLMPMFVLAVLAGAFIALGAVFAITVSTGHLPFGISRLLAGTVFCLGLVLVVVAGAELFTGNNLIIMAYASGKVGSKALLRNWSVVYLGNFVGALSVALLVAAGGHFELAGGDVGRNAVSIAAHKLDLGFGQAVALGTLCNVLVCLAVWLCMSARTTTDKILAIFFPIAAFVAAGFEHSVANMFFVPYAIFAGQATPDLAVGADLSWASFLVDNLLPVTLGNVLGGAVLVGVVYWFVYLRVQKASTDA
ncbi:MAG: formate/nitrite transporter [Deltaproteobacteria bacterium]|nr:formate/nitrite transporter [Deltaproteobacteria bacterium]